MFNPTYFPRQRWTYPKEHERNLVASFFHAVSITLLSTSLIHMVWFRINGGVNCTPYITLNQFFTLGYFETRSGKPIRYSGDVVSSPMTNMYHSSSGGNSILYFYNSLKNYRLVCFFT